MQTVKFSYKKEAKQNPYIGFVSFQHFRKDELYSDLIVRPENNMTETEHVECYPVPDYVEEKGRAQGYYPDNSVVYIRILWKEFEPKQNEFNYAFIDDILDKAEQNGQTVMFRLMQHSTRESDDVPDWVKEIVECPARPIGQRIKISPKDPKFLELFGNAIAKFGERYDKDDRLSMVDISLPGAWGEGSSCNLFTEEQLKKFVSIYTNAFKNTMLIGQIDAPYLINYMNEIVPVGWRADCIGKPDLLFRGQEMHDTMGDLWKRAHISFESYWWLGEWKRKGWSLDDVIEKTLSWHASTFNGKSLPIPVEWKDKVDEWVAKMGYHFVIDEVTLPESIKAGEKLQLTVKIENIGVAPIYNEMPLYIKLKNGNEQTIIKTEVDARSWIEGKYEEQISVDVPAILAKGEYSVQLGMGGGNTPSAVFATTAEQDGDFSVIAKLIVE